MSRKYKFHDNDKLYFISFAVVNWIDFFVREEYNQEIIKSWEDSIKNKGLQIYGWCIMTSHVHMIIGSNGKMKLDKIVGEMKSFTSTRFRNLLSENPQESRKEWMMWIACPDSSGFERAGKKNSNNNDWSRRLGSSSTTSL